MMKQLQISRPRRAEWVDVPAPVCPRDGLLIRTTHTAISTGTELRVYRGIAVDSEGRFLHERVPFQLPAANGYSLVGSVLEIGPEAAGFQPGDRVFATAPHAEMAAVSTAQAVKLPPAIPDEQAVFLNILEVGHLALRRGRPAPGEFVAVVGLGVVGLSVVAFARAFGFRTVGIDPVAQRRSIASEIGAEGTVDPNAPDSAEQVVAFCEGAGADLVVECASVWSAIEFGMRIAAEEATVVVAARHTDVPQFNPVGHPHLGQKLTLLTSYGHPPAGTRWDRTRSLALTLELLRHRRLPIAPLITNRFPAEQLPSIYDRLDAGELNAVGMVLEWS